MLALTRLQILSILLLSVASIKPHHDVEYNRDSFEGELTKIHRELLRQRRAVQVHPRRRGHYKDVHDRIGQDTTSIGQTPEPLITIDSLVTLSTAESTAPPPTTDSTEAFDTATFLTEPTLDTIPTMFTTTPTTKSTSTTTTALPITISFQTTTTATSTAPATSASTTTIITSLPTSTTTPPPITISFQTTTTATSTAPATSASTTTIFTSLPTSTTTPPTTTTTTPPTTTTTTPPTTTTTTPTTTTTKIPVIVTPDFNATISGRCTLLTISPSHYQLLSPNYPRRYKPNERCKIVITPKRPRLMKVTPSVKRLGVDDRLIIKSPYKNTLRLTKNYTRSELYPTAALEITFRAAKVKQGRNFTIDLEVLTNKCNRIISIPEGGSGTLELPGNFASQPQCEWWLKAPAGRKIELKFEEADLQRLNCRKNYVVVNTQGLPDYDMKNKYTAGNNRFCRNEAAKTLTSVGNRMNVLINARPAKMNFRATYTLV
ncbi:cell wall protein DAN4 [Hyalella azteca]|uniref:Cell wall protein DAN4 n=1 Tax=Hyalella azteca TaxID=294128 RepID=A0A8B7N460_HYAAZ|nr:cell wall protein DAN4 [Hyalella azteca]